MFMPQKTLWNFAAYIETIGAPLRMVGNTQGYREEPNEKE
jgi:hypothetical protein